MAKAKVTPIDQKTKLLEQMKELEEKIAHFDNQRAVKIATLAKRYQLVDLDDTTLETEFKTIRDKYQESQSGQLEPLDESKKNSTVKDTA